MADQKTAQEVTDRFAAEQEYIQRYMEFLRVKGSIREEHLREVSHALERAGLPGLPLRGDWRRAREPYSHAETVGVITTIERTRPALEEAIVLAQDRLDGLKAPEGLGGIDVRSTVGEWIQFFLDGFGDQVDEDRVAALRADAVRQQEDAIREYGEEEVDVLSDEQIDFALSAATFLIANRSLDRLLYAKDQFAEIELASRLAAPEAELNVLRQGFLLLTTAFDAAVFDLFRVGLAADFFGRIGSVGGREKISVDRFSNYGTFEAFRDDLIEELLRSKYLKDVLYILNSMGVVCTSVEHGDRFVDLIELVLRRNVHVHNRGIADERYLERNANGTPRYNIYNLAAGSVAVVDLPYWEKANRLCTSCVRAIGAWAVTQVV